MVRVYKFKKNGATLSGAFFDDLDGHISKKRNFYKLYNSRKVNETISMLSGILGLNTSENLEN